MIDVLLLSLAAATPVALADEGPARFAEPVRLLAAGEPINYVEEMPYPSPVMFDIDRDGTRELICGDLWGYLWVYEDEGDAGDLRWSAAQKLTSNGELLKVPNW